MRAWKWIGVAGIAGVAATGVVIARNERERRGYTPDEVRNRLHERAESLDTAVEVAPEPVGRRFLSRFLRRRPTSD